MTICSSRNRLVLLTRTWFALQHEMYAKNDTFLIPATIDSTLVVGLFSLRCKQRKNAKSRHQTRPTEELTNEFRTITRLSSSYERIKNPTENRFLQSVVWCSVAVHLVRWDLLQHLIRRTTNKQKSRTNLEKTEKSMHALSKTIEPPLDCIKMCSTVGGFRIKSICRPEPLLLAWFQFKSIVTWFHKHNQLAIESHSDYSNFSSASFDTQQQFAAHSK